MRLLRMLIGLLLVPVAVALTRTVIALLSSIQPDSAFVVPPSFFALASGYLLWLVAYFTLPRPFRTYVLAHELTHALWGAVMGAKIFRLSVSRHKGSVTLSKNNVLITLAPYFFPLYTVLVVVGFYALSIFYDVGRYELIWLGLVGFTWGFHFTFTVSTLMQHQTDIQACGYVFSYAFIYVMNVVGIGLWIVLVSTPTLEAFIRFTALYLQDSGGACVALGSRLVNWLQ
jgi:hypothetical protein